MNIRAFEKINLNDSLIWVSTQFFATAAAATSKNIYFKSGQEKPQKYQLVAILKWLQWKNTRLSNGRCWINILCFQLLNLMIPLGVKSHDWE